MENNLPKPRIATLSVSKIEEYLKFLKTVIDKGRTANISAFENQRADFQKKLQQAKYWDFISSADYHYFVARVLFLSSIGIYSFFCGQQSIENYLKAFLKYKGQVIPLDHNLEKLLKKCRLVDKNEKFISSNEIEVVAKRFNPFYELPRYPVHITGPKENKYAFIWPDDIYILDYFVLKMREILKVPNNTWDILRNGHFQFPFNKENSDFYEIFKCRNINFNPAETDQ